MGKCRLDHCTDKTTDRPHDRPHGQSVFPIPSLARVTRRVAFEKRRHHQFPHRQSGGIGGDFLRQPIHPEHRLPHRAGFAHRIHPDFFRGLGHHPGADFECAVAIIGHHKRNRRAHRNHPVIPGENGIGDRPRRCAHARITNRLRGFIVFYRSGSHAIIQHQEGTDFIIAKHEHHALGNAGTRHIDWRTNIRTPFRAVGGHDQFDQFRGFSAHRFFDIYDLPRTNEKSNEKSDTKFNTKFNGDFLYPLLSGIVLSCCLVFYNTYTTAELAGVYAGLTTTAAILLFELMRFGSGLLAEFVRDRSSLLNLFAPYLLLIALIGFSRISVVYEALQNLFRLENGNVKLFVFTSPGVFIFLTVIFIFAFSEKYRRHSHAFYHGIKRSVYPVAGIMMFVVFAQLHRTSGIFKDIASRIINLQLSEITFISPLLGMLSGYTTGSNVGGNALFMSLQSESGIYFDRQLVFAALQNSSAGHSVFMSLPIILLTLSIARSDDTAIDNTHQTWLIRRSLLYAPLIYAALVIPFYLLMT